MKAPAENLLRIGTIAQVHGPVVDIACTVLPPLHQALVSKLITRRTRLRSTSIWTKPARGRSRCTIRRDCGGGCRSSTEAPRFMCRYPRMLEPSAESLWRTVDGKPPLASAVYRNIIAKPGPLHSAKAATTVLETGIKVIDLLCPVYPRGKNRTLRRCRGR